MKNLSIIFLVVSMGIFSGCVVAVEDDIFPIRGNGFLMNYSQISGSPFEKINIVGSAEVRFHASQEYRTVVTVDSNLFGYTEVFTRGNALNIGTKHGNYSFTRYLVDVYCPVLTGVSISGSGSFAGSDAICTSTLDINVSGSGKIEGPIICDNFIAKITGSGKITVFGSATDADIIISGSGSFNGYSFVITSADVRITGSGNADVYVTDYLSADISGSGRINYLGNPTVSSRVIGSGKIKQR